ncbi:MAG: HEPN domain-containing protein [Firmicutes bacterium]|nr:HEPN domain-containing protein [Bacillota bacterium]
MNKKTYIFTFKMKSPGRDFGDYPDIISKALLRLWGQISTHFSFFKISTVHGLLNISINWAPAMQAIQNSYQLEQFSPEQLSTGKIPKELMQFEKWDKFNLRLKVTLDNLDFKSDVKKRELGEYLQNYLYHLFLISNLSAPGCFNLFNTSLKNNTFLKINNSTFQLSSSSFDISWIRSIQSGWPKIKSVSLPKVLKWYNKLNLGLRQLANSRVERGLFALLHVCKGNSPPDPTDLLWLAHALEALYDAPQSSIEKTLRNRIFLVLGSPDKDSKKVEKNIKEFYDLRSRFVHGDLPISIPDEDNELLDSRMPPYYDTLLESYDLAFSIVLATLQKMILNNWYCINFLENYKGGSSPESVDT